MIRQATARDTDGHLLQQQHSHCPFGFSTLAAVAAAPTTTASATRCKRASSEGCASRQSVRRQSGREAGRTESGKQRYTAAGAGSADRPAAEAASAVEIEGLTVCECGRSAHCQVRVSTSLLSMRVGRRIERRQGTKRSQNAQRLP